MEDALKTAASALGYSLDGEVGRYEARELISAFLRPWFRRRTLAQIAELFTDRSLLWGPYRTVRQMLDEDPRCSEANPMFRNVEHPGIGTVLTASTPLGVVMTRTSRMPPSISVVRG